MLCGSRQKLAALAWVAIGVATVEARGQLVRWGGPDEARSLAWWLQGGRLADLDGRVRETKRAGTEIPGWQAGYGKRLESYSLQELGFDASCGTVGTGFEKSWRFLRLALDVLYAGPTVEGIAPRDFYLGVDKVSYGGSEYEYLMIPRGSRYEGEIQAVWAALKMRATPMHLAWGEALAFAPWMSVGVCGLLGKYDLDAGPARGLVSYEVPPREYVVGGTAEGLAGAALPRWGVGGEVRAFLGRSAYGPVTLRAGGDAYFLDYAGDTDALGISARHDKALDLTYRGYELQAVLHVPFSAAADLLVGVQFERLEASATAEARGDVTDEKYDKDVRLELSRSLAIIGLRF